MRVLITLGFFAISFFAKSQTNTVKPETLAEAQLVAYNNKDIEAFLTPYSDSVEVYLFPNILQYKGKGKMRAGYSDMFAKIVDLKCTLVSRVVVGNKVIDEESVVFDKSRPAMHAVAIYTIEEGKIAKVHFIQ